MGAVEVAAYSIAVFFERFHDVRVVWPPEAQRGAIVGGDFWELGHRLF
jgi:hypothetical protein